MIDENLVLIRNKVYPAIADLLGKYKVPTKTGVIETEAITVLEHSDLAYDYPIEGTGLTGLECVIVPTAIASTEFIQERQLNRTYVILLFQRDKNKGVREAIDRLLQTDLQIIPNGVNIDIETPKSKTYKVGSVTVRYYSQVRF